MTWTISATNDDRGTALREFADRVNASPSCTMKDDVLHAATHLSWRVPPGRPITLSTHGYMTESGVGSATVSISTHRPT